MPLSVLNWQVEVDFKVDGGAHNMFGDGFAIWLSKDRAKVGSVFGSVGEWILCLFAHLSSANLARGNDSDQRVVLSMTDDLRLLHGPRDLLRHVRLPLHALRQH